MSHFYPHQRSRVVRSMGNSARGMGDEWLDEVQAWWNRKAGDFECAPQGEAAAAPFFAQVSDLEANWHPNGFYSIAQVETLLEQAQRVLTQGEDAVNRVAAEAQLPGHRQVLDNERSSIRNTSAESLTYIDAIRQARNQGLRVIDSPGLRDYIIKAFRRAARGVQTSAMIACLKPWWVDILATIGNILGAAYEIVKAIVGIAVAVGEAVLTIPATAARVWTYVKYGVLIGAAYWLYTGGHKRLMASLEGKIGV